MLIEEAGVLFGQVFHGLLFDELNAQARGVPNLNMTVDDDALGQTTDDLVPEVWGVGIFECSSRGIHMGPHHRRRPG